jgi:hypothetical protein
MDTMSTTMFDIKASHRMRIMIKSTRFADIRTSLGMRSPADLLEATGVLKQLCYQLLLELKDREKCTYCCKAGCITCVREACHTFCAVHVSWVDTMMLSESFDDSKTNDQVWEEIESCPECNARPDRDAVTDCIRVFMIDLPCSRRHRVVDVGSRI